MFIQFLIQLTYYYEVIGFINTFRISILKIKNTELYIEMKKVGVGVESC